MEPERSKPPLHNFSLPCLKWGTQRLLRCVNTNNPSPPNPNSSKLDSTQHHSNLKNHEPINDVRQRMGDLKVAAEKLQVSIFENNEGGADAIVNGVVVVGGGGGGGNCAIRPWNLRTRRAACKAPPPSPRMPVMPKDEGIRFFDVGGSSPKKKMVMVNEKVKFSVSLSKEEVEQDFWAFVGSRPPRRPRKRPRIVQRQLNTLLPGMWLAEVTAESYKVSEVPE